MEEVKDDKKEEKAISIDDLESQFSKADQAHKEIRDQKFSWDDREELFRGRYKDPNEKTESIMSTGELTTLAIDGSCRVMAQLPSGRFYNYDGNTGANMLLNLLFEHYVVPNATSGGALLIKQRTVNLYSRVFGTIPVFIDWKVSDTYTGPDMVIIHPRRFRPQPGKIAIEDMDYCFVDVEVSKEWLEDRDITVWKNVDKVLLQYKDKSDEGVGTPELERSPEDRGRTKTGITLRHRFSQNGDWIVYAPTAKQILVDEKKYYPCIPIAVKHQYPRLDQFWAMADFDRGEMIQKSIDSLMRMYQDGIAMSIDPPIVMDPEDVVLSSIARQPKSKWFVKNGKVDSIKMQTVSPQGMQTFQGTYQILKGNLLSLGASTDTAVAAQVDPGFGKTPEALKQQGARQGARDAWDTFMQEQFIERAYTIMADMLAMKGVDDFAFNLIGNSIKKIQEQYPDEDFSQILGSGFNDGMARVSPEKIKGRYRFVIDSGSMAVKTDDTGAKILSLIETYAKYPEIKADFAQRGQRIDFGEAFKRMVIDSGIADAEKIIVTQENPNSLPGVGQEGATIDPTQDPNAMTPDVGGIDPNQIMSQEQYA